jgi:hypothetical protein
LIFGLEHWVVGKQVYNLIIEVLPFKASNKYKSCAVSVRLKNHYAPSELEIIDSLRLTPANMLHKPKNYYHKVNWNGVSFATYNCFELSDIVRIPLIPDTDSVFNRTPFSPSFSLPLFLLYLSGLCQFSH